MKEVVILSGPPGVRKTTISRLLFESIDGCAWLDADWCWMIDPWIPKTDSEKRVVEETFRKIIDTYLQNDKIKTIILIG